MWKGLAKGKQYTAIHYKNTESTAIYFSSKEIAGGTRRIFPTKIW